MNDLHQESSWRASNVPVVPDFSSPETIRICREFASDAEYYAALATEPCIRESLSRIAQHWNELAELTEAADVPAIPVPTERRTAPRKKTLLFGKIAFSSEAKSLDCTIRDISISGARIALPQAETIPANVYLIIMRSGIAYQAEVRWRAGSQLGLRFGRSFSLDGDASEVEFLKPLWQDGYPACPADESAALSQMGYFETSYKGYRIVVVSEAGGYVAYTHGLDYTPRGGSGMGKKITNRRYETVDLAIAAAKTWCNAALSGATGAD